MKNKILEIKNLNLFYKKSQILKDVSFDIYEGELIMLSGHNGSGKSSIISSIMHDFKEYPSNISGEIIYDNKNLLKEKDIQYFRSVVGYMKQADTFSENTCLKQIMMSVKYAKADINKSEIIDMFKEYGLEDYINKNPNNLIGYFSVLELTKKSFLLDFVLQNTYEAYVIDIIKYVKTTLTKNNDFQTLYIRLNGYYSNFKELCEILDMEYKNSSESRILVKDFLVAKNRDYTYERMIFNDITPAF